METPVPFPNTEAKHVTSVALVSVKRRNSDVVFFNFLTTKFMKIKINTKNKKNKIKEKIKK